MDVGESIAVPGLPPKDEPVFECAWKNCEKNHTKKPVYPGGGKTTRSKTYSDKWVAAGLEPWVIHGPGKNSVATLADYRKETPKASYAVTAAALAHPEYHTQKHHLISINLFKGVKDLAHNARLVGYDVNSKTNGICLPSYIADIVQHDLQCHRGRHPKHLYGDKVKVLLGNLERRCIDYCALEMDGDIERQSQLLGDLDRLSRRISSEIQLWNWLLRKNARKERARSNARYHKLS